MRKIDKNTQPPKGTRSGKQPFFPYPSVFAKSYVRCEQPRCQIGFSHKIRPNREHYRDYSDDCRVKNSEYDQETQNHKLPTKPWHRKEEPHNNHENTTIINCRHTLGTWRKSHTLITRNQEDKLGKPSLITAGYHRIPQ